MRRNIAGGTIVLLRQSGKRENGVISRKLSSRKALANYRLHGN
jgi:hypothetical protein